MRKIGFFFAAALALALFSARPSSADTPPNILLIIGDDVGYPFYGFMGHPDVQTPALDSVAAGGTVFPVSYNTSSICRPSNPGILTGLHAKDFTVVNKGLSTATPTIANLLGDAGYVSLQTGKSWPGGIGDQEQAYGFDEIDHLSEHEIGRSTMQPIYDFVDAHLNQPWFVWYAPFIPHVPNTPPPDLLHLYDDLDAKRKVKAYYASMTQLDRTVQELLDFLTSRNELQNTIIIYLSDNGYLLPKSKGSWTANGYRTPIVVRDYRSATPGGVRTELAESVDILPTILDYAGVAMPVGPYDGVSLRPIAENQTVPGWRQYILGHHVKKFGNGFPKRHLRSQDGYTFYLMCSGKAKMYDVNADPNEKKDLGKFNPTLFAAKYDQFKAILDAWWDPC